MTPTELVAFQAEIHVTQKQLAEILGVAHRIVYRWQTGLDHIPPEVDVAVASIRRHRADMAGNSYPLASDVYRVMAEEGVDQPTAVHLFGVPQ